MIDSCKKEIIELHQFFEDWFCGRLPDTDDAFTRLQNCLATDFEMITPNAQIVSRDDLIKQLRSMNGAYLDNEKPSAIWIDDVSGRQLTDNLYLMRYCEWQGDNDHANAKGRLSSAFFQHSPAPPNGVQWIHLHEVWI